MEMEGHENTGIRLNVRRELKRIKVDPLKGFLDLAYPNPSSGDIRSRYEDAYRLYYLSMHRALEQVSTTVRFRKGPYYVFKYGGKYGPRQRKLAKKYWNSVPFLELDITTCLIQTRMLLDRMIGLSRRFLSGSELPSFTSFSNHKKFFVSGKRIWGHKAYGNYLTNNTAWFDVPIKFVRDKLLVHQGPRHYKYLALPGWGVEDDLVWYFQLLGEPPHGKPRTRVPPERTIRVNVIRLSYDIENFLRWFSSYGSNVVMKRG
jgi:hypothetical protein